MQEAGCIKLTHSCEFSGQLPELLTHGMDRIVQWLGSWGKNRLMSVPAVWSSHTTLWGTAQARSKIFFLFARNSELNGSCVVVTVGDLSGAQALHKVLEKKCLKLQSENYVLLVFRKKKTNSGKETLKTHYHREPTTDYKTGTVWVLTHSSRMCLCIALSLFDIIFNPFRVA